MSPMSPGARYAALDGAIETLGEHQVPTRLHRHVTAAVTVNLLKEGRGLVTCKEVGDSGGEARQEG